MHHMIMMHMIIYYLYSVGTTNVPAAAANGFASSSSSQTHFHSATAAYSSMRPMSARSAASEQSYASRSTIPPTPPTRDRTRLEPYADRNTSRCGLELATVADIANCSLKTLQEKTYLEKTDRLIGASADPYLYQKGR